MLFWNLELGIWNFNPSASSLRRLHITCHSPHVTRPSPPPIIPNMACLRALQRLAAGQDGARQKAEVFAGAIQMHFARGGEDGVAMQDGDAFALSAREFFEAFAEFDFFAGEEVGVESAEFPERGGIAKNERTGDPSQCAAHTIPESGDGVPGRVSGFEADGAAASEAAASFNGGGDVIEERGAGVRVGVDEDEPVAGGGGGAAIARATDLVDGFKDDLGAGGAGDFRGAVGGVVVANDEFGLPSAPGKGGHGVLDVAKGFAQKAFFVEGGDDDRN